MRHLGGICAFLLMAAGASAKERDVSGVVTYLTSTSVYASIGSEAGVSDSTLLFVIVQHDTLARLQVFAVSSKSSVCRILESKTPLFVGAKVVGVVDIAEARQQTPAAEKGTNPSAFLPGLPTARAWKEQEPIGVRGRISAQFYGTRHDASAYNVSQPGIVLSMNAHSNEIPVSFDIYANLRSQSYGGNSPFSGQSINRTRIYRLAVRYDNKRNTFTIGRFSPSFVPSIGYIDGAMASTAVKRFSFGAAAGFQPAFSQRGVSTDYRKVVLFTTYDADSSGTSQITLAYARIYYRSLLDREATSVSGRITISPSVSLYANADVDLRAGSVGGFTLSPRISQVIINANYRILPAVGIGLGANAIRPLYPYSVVRTLPSSLIDTELRGGVSFSVHLYLPAGISLTNTYTPRTSEGGFADNFTDYASLTFSNVAYSGFSVRSNFTMGENEYTRTHGFGMNLFKNWWEMFDLTMRFQQSSYTVKSFELTGESTTMGVDMMVPFSRRFALTGTFERLESPGIRMNTIFAELTVRF